ncbi:MAG: hypothetical protein IPL95_16355 [Saprospiraceae bacterium]|nr:hypothetical protein [Saprospiraceae bacterium]
MDWYSGDGAQKRLIDYIYPASIAITDNYLIFKFKKSPKTRSEDRFWTYIAQLNKDLENKRLEPSSCEDAYLPTSGVFAEAILGRSNASEFVKPKKILELAGFAHTFSSPQISPVQAGNHVVTDQTSALAPNIPTSNLNIINPPQYALPTSLNSAFQAIQNGNMFRDMSKSGEMVSILSSLADLANNTAKLFEI